MKIYTLLYHENSDTLCASDVMVFASRADAEDHMRTLYRESIKNLGHDESRTEDGYDCYCDEHGSYITEGLDEYSWKIEDHELELPATDLAVEVSGGVVQNIYAYHPINQIRADVCDEDDDTYDDYGAPLLEACREGNGWEQIY